MPKGNPNPKNQWVKGQSGRSTTIRPLTGALRSQLSDVDPGTGLTVGEMLASYWLDRAMKGHFKAFELIMNYVEGKPREAIDLSGNLGITGQVSIYIPDNDRSNNEDHPESEGPKESD